MLTTWIQAVYQFLWGDLLRTPLPGGSSFGVSLLIILLIPTGIYFTIRTRFLPVRLFGDMVRALTGKKKEDRKDKETCLYCGALCNLRAYLLGRDQSGDQ